MCRVGDVHIALNGAVAVRKRFTERDRAAHRQEGDGVDAHPPSSQIADDGYGKGDDPGTVAAVRIPCAAS